MQQIRRMLNHQLVPMSLDFKDSGIEEIPKSGARQQVEGEPSVMGCLKVSHQIEQVVTELFSGMVKGSIVEPGCLGKVYGVVDLSQGRLDLLDTVELYHLDLEQPILLTLHLMELIPKVVQAVLVEPTHEHSKDAIDEHHQKAALDPELVGSCHGGDRCFVYSGQEGFEAVVGVEHTIGVLDCIVE